MSKKLNNPYPPPPILAVNKSLAENKAGRNYNNMKKLTEDILKQDILTESDVKLLCKRANAGEIIETPTDKSTYELTPEQNKKAFDWLIGQWKTPKGVERENNPFGLREQQIVASFKHCTLEQLYDAGNQHYKWYVPLYNVISESGSCFQYYVAGGKPVIIG